MFSTSFFILLKTSSLAWNDLSLTITQHLYQKVIFSSIPKSHFADETRRYSSSLFKNKKINTETSRIESDKGD